MESDRRTGSVRDAETGDPIESLNKVLADVLDLYLQMKVAHWNVRGPRFPSLHPLFDSFAKDLRGHIDEIAERAVALGGLARGDVRDVAAESALERFPADLSTDLEVVRTLVLRYDVLGERARQVRDACEAADPDTFDVLTDAVRDLDKHAWMLRATLGEAANVQVGSKSAEVPMHHHHPTKKGPRAA